MKTEYTKRFLTKSAVDEYMSLYSEEGSYANIVYAIEKDFLLDAVRKIEKRAAYLDFAVGTGRIISVLESYFHMTEGIDISSEMIKVAARRVRNAQVHSGDITTGMLAGKRYDLITAFRFFLNAEPALRENAMVVLAGMLRDSESLLVVNNHGRLCSIKIASYLTDVLRTKLLGLQPKQAFVSDKVFHELIKVAGLRVDRFFGYSVLGGRLASLVGSRITRQIERAMCGSRVAALFGTSRIYVLSISKG